MSDEDKVVDFPGITRLDLPPNKVMANAMKAGLESAIIIGENEDGDLIFFLSQADAADALWLLEKAKKALLDGVLE